MVGRVLPPLPAPVNPSPLAARGEEAWSAPLQYPQRQQHPQAASVFCFSRNHHDFYPISMTTVPKPDSAMPSHCVSSNTGGFLFSRNFHVFGLLIQNNLVLLLATKSYHSRKRPGASYTASRRRHPLCGGFYRGCFTAEAMSGAPQAAKVLTEKPLRVLCENRLCS